MRGRGGGVLHKLEERWIRGQWKGGELACSPLRQSRANASTVGWRVRHRVRRGGGDRVEWVITGAQRGEACNQPALRKECSSSSHVITAI